MRKVKPILKTKEETVLIVSPEVFRVNKGELRLSERQLSSLDNVIEDEIKIIKDHFRKDGWDLDSDFYVNEVARQVFGDLNDYIRFQLINKLKGVNLAFKDNQFVYTKAKPKKAAKKRKKS